MHPRGCNCVNSLFPVFNIYVKRICLQVVSTPQTTLFIAAVCSKVRRDSFIHTPIVNNEYISLTFFELGGKLDFVNRIFVYKVLLIFIRFLNDIGVFRMFFFIVVEDCAEPCKVIVLVKGGVITNFVRIKIF